ncbi:hypothetical protein V8B97DRAFT_163437 [Scleroderma yunnanense]
MVKKQTFVQRVLHRPSRTYATGITATAGTVSPQPAQGRRSRDFHSTKQELARIAADLQIQSTLQLHPNPSLSQPRVSFLDQQSSTATVVCHDDETENRTSDDSGDSVFYTPKASPTSNSSPATHSPAQPSGSLVPQQLSPAESPTITPLTSAASSTASLGSTVPASPDDIQFSTSLPDKLPSSSSVTMIPITPRSRRKQLPPQRKLTYTDDDWAKDVRWLVAPDANGTQKHKKRRSASLTISDPASRLASGAPSPGRSSYAPPRTCPLSKSHGHSKSKSAAAYTMVGMTALLEVEEPLDDSNGQQFTSPPNGAVGRKRSQSFLCASKLELSSGTSIPQSSRSKTHRLTKQRSSSLPSLLLPAGAATPKHPSSPVCRSHSRTSSYSTFPDPVRRAASTISRPMSSMSHATSSTSKSPYTSAPSNALDALAAHVSMSDIPDALPSSGTRGFTSLVLPHAAPSTALETNHNAKSWKSSGRGRPTSVVVSESISIGLGLGDGVDLTRTGLAQTTMASIEVVRGIAGGSTRLDRRGAKSRRGSMFGIGWFTGKDKNEKEKRTSVSEESENPLDFTSYRVPPMYVGGNAVLVQVWAVGLDGTDARLVGVIPGRGPPNAPYGLDVTKDGDKLKTRTPPVGYIPGRSFVGRVLEVGWEIREEILRRGDWVFGLMSVQKCGALTEFILVDRHRIHRIPQPSIPRRTTLSANGLISPLANGDVEEDRNALLDRSTSFRSGRNGLSVDELALLPLSGVPAYRAVRTLLPISRTTGTAHRQDPGLSSTTHPLIPPIEESSFPANGGLEGSSAPCQAGDTRPRALVVRAHDGPGALAVQMLVREGWCVWAQVPVPFALPGPVVECSEETRDEEEGQVLEARRSVLRRLEERLRGWGVDEVLFVPVTSSPLSASLSSPSINDVPRSSSSSSPSTSPSPFSTSGSGSSPISSPVSSPYSHVHSSTSSSGGHNPHALSNPSCLPLPFFQPYSFTPLPLPAYNTEQDSVAALFAYLERACVRVDAILDTVGGRGVWEAGRALLARPVRVGESARGDVEAQFTTVVGDAPDRVVASAGDNFRAGVRALRVGGSGKGSKEHQREYEDMHLQDPFDALGGGASGYVPTASEREKGKQQRVDKGNKAKATKTKIKLKPRTVNYTWVSLVSDVDWEGDSVCDTLRSVLRLAVEHGVRPAIGPLDFPPSLSSSSSSDGGSRYKDKGKKRAVFPGGENIEDEVMGKVVPFENTPSVFTHGSGLEYGGTVVSRIAG